MAKVTSTDLGIREVSETTKKLWVPMIKKLGGVHAVSIMLVANNGNWKQTTYKTALRTFHCTEAVEDEITDFLKAKKLAA